MVRAPCTLAFLGGLPVQRNVQSQAGQGCGLETPRWAGRKREAGATAFNALITCILVAILISVGLTYGFQVVRVAREEALRYELANIRTAIVLFAALNRRFPGSLQELVKTEYLLPDQEFFLTAGTLELEKRTGFNRSYIEPNSVDADGRILDPFGTPYRYNPQNGQVTAVEERYGQW